MPAPRRGARTVLLVTTGGSSLSLAHLRLISFHPSGVSFNIYRIPDRIFGPTGPRQPSSAAGDRGDTSGRRAPSEVLPSHSGKCPNQSNPPAPAGRSGGSCPTSSPSLWRPGNLHLP